MQHIVMADTRKSIIYALQFLIRLYRVTPLELLGRKNKPFYDNMDNFNRIWKDTF